MNPVLFPEALHDQQVIDLVSPEPDDPIPPDVETVEPIPRAERPTYRVHLRAWRFAYRSESKPKQPGLWFHGWKAGRGRGDPGEPVDVRICRPAWKVATTKTVDDGTFGVLVELIDLRGRRRLVALPCGALAGDGIAAVRELEAAGIQATHDRLLVHWLRCAPPEKLIMAMRRTGWTPGFDAFVLPDRTIGNSDAMFAPGTAPSGAGFARAGAFA
ncbi:MAG: DUF927 domain-containing protein, partial [Anaerolineae bacterium]|nr:DUF927 domain-containing protein [Anaerolineae bacterium]